jgi:hypothetical protein
VSSYFSCAEPKSHSTHTRRIPGSLFVRDGRPFAILFRKYRQPLLDTDSERKHEFQLLSDQKMESEHSLNDYSLSVHVFPHYESNPEIERLIMKSGCGYMANTCAREHLNVRIVHVDVRKDHVGPPALFMIATKDIPANTEIFSPYNNTDPLTGKIEDMN